MWCAHALANRHTECLPDSPVTRTLGVPIQSPLCPDACTNRKPRRRDVHPDHEPVDLTDR